MKNYNYFDDDESVDKVLAEVRNRSRIQSEEEKKHDRREVVYAIKDFNKNRGDSVQRGAGNFSPRSRRKSFDIKNPIDIIEHENLLHKKTILRAMLLVFLMFFICVIAVTIHSIRQDNKDNTRFNADAGVICAQYSTRYGNCNYEALYNKYTIKGYRMKGLCYLREIDFNNDGDSELLMVFRDSGTYYVEVWGYNGDKEFVTLFHEKTAQRKKKSHDAWVTLYKKNKKYYVGTHSKKDLSEVKLYGLKGDEFEEKYSCTYDKKKEEFTIKNKVDDTSFERVMLSVISGRKAVEYVEKVSGLINTFSAASDEAVSAESIGKSMNSAYYSIVEDYNQRYGKAKYVEKNGRAYVKGLAVVDLIDFNDDGKDELLIIYRKSVKGRTTDYNGIYVPTSTDRYYIEIYRYTGSGASLAYKNEGISNSLNNEYDRYYIIKTDNGKSFYCQNTFSTESYGNIVSAASTMLRMKKTSFVPMYSSSYYTEYGYTEYQIDDREIYNASAFEQAGYKIPLFNGSNKYDHDLFTVTYLQRKLKNNDDVKGRVTKTQKTIKKLNPSYSG